MRSRNPPKINKNLSLGPWIVPWSPKVSKWRHQACQMTGFGHQKLPYPSPKWKLCIKKVTWKLTSRNQRANTHFSRDIFLNIQEPNIQKPAGQQQRGRRQRAKPLRSAAARSAPPVGVLEPRRRKTSTNVFRTDKVNSLGPAPTGPS